MSGKPKIHTYQSMNRLVQRLRDDLNSGGQDCVSTPTTAPAKHAYRWLLKRLARKKVSAIRSISTLIQKICFTGITI